MWAAWATAKRSRRTARSGLNRPGIRAAGPLHDKRIVRNAKAKIIERASRDVKDHLSRLFDTFTGGNVLEKPESLKFILKDGRIPLDSTLVETVEELLDWYFNQQPYGGAVAKDHGKPRQQVYNENLHTKRVASAEDLNLMLMRSSRRRRSRAGAYTWTSRASASTTGTTSWCSITWASRSITATTRTI